MSTIDGKDPTRYQAGLKATLKNPNVSEEAKESASERLQKFEADFGSTGRGASGAGSADYDDEYEGSGQQISGNQARGYKATISNPNTSDQAKRHARDVLNGNEDDVELAPGSEYASDAANYVSERGSASGTGGRGADGSADAHNNRVLGGYKATVHNPNMTENTKEAAREKLDAAGVDY